MNGYKTLYFFAAVVVVFAFVYFSIAYAFNTEVPFSTVATFSFLGGLAGAAGKALKAQEARIRQLEQALAESRSNR